MTTRYDQLLDDVRRFLPESTRFFTPDLRADISSAINLAEQKLSSRETYGSADLYQFTAIFLAGTVARDARENGHPEVAARLELIGHQIEALCSTLDRVLPG